MTWIKNFHFFHRCLYVFSYSVVSALCSPMDCSLPGSSVHRIFQAIVLEWIAISFSRGSSRPRDWTRVFHIVDRCFTIWANINKVCWLFTIARTWKQPRCPSADEWIRKLWYIYTMEYYSAIKKNAFESVRRWMKRAYYREQSKSERKTPIQYINAYIWNLERWLWWPYMWDSKRDTDVKNRLLDSVGEGKGGMIWENSIETCILSYVK